MRVINDSVARELGIPSADIERVSQQQREEVDDGIVNGSTIRASIEGPSRDVGGEIVGTVRRLKSVRDSNHSPTMWCAWRPTSPLARSVCGIRTSPGPQTRRSSICWPVRGSPEQAIGNAGRPG